MSSTGLLIFALAFVPALIAARVWWYVTHVGEDLTGYRPIEPVKFKD